MVFVQGAGVKSLIVVLVVGIRKRIGSLTRLVCLVLGISASFAGLKAATPSCPCRLGWNPSPDPTVAGYGIYYAAAGSSTTNYLAVGLTNQATLFCLSARTAYVFYVVAYDANGVQSPPSNLVSYNPPVLSPLTVAPSASGTVNLQFSAAPGTPCHVEYTPALNPPQWQTLGSATADDCGNVLLTDTVLAGSPSRFYRAVTP